MTMGVKRRDYARNVRSRHPKGCTWCGSDVPSPVTSASYCSDLCVQRDHDGLDDVPPVVPCGDPRGMSEEAKSRAIQRMNDSYNEWASGRSEEDRLSHRTRRPPPPAGAFVMHTGCIASACPIHPSRSNHFLTR